jgi:predicted transcriptional regulator
MNDLEVVEVGMSVEEALMATHNRICDEETKTKGHLVDLIVARGRVYAEYIEEGYSQRDCAKFFGVSLGTISNYLTVYEALSGSAGHLEEAKNMEDVSLNKLIALIKPKTTPKVFENYRAEFSMYIRSLVYLASGGKCNNCSKFITIDDYECDHIVPCSKGGDNDIDNAQALCRHCNRSKSDKGGI